MTSRSEYRLLHRQDNADQRLTRIGGEIGLIPPERVQAVEEKYAQVRREVQRLESSGVPASEELNAMLERTGTAPVANSRPPGRPSAPPAGELCRHCCPLIRSGRN